MMRERVKKEPVCIAFLEDRCGSFVTVRPQLYRLDPINGRNVGDVVKLEVADNGYGLRGICHRLFKFKITL